MIRISFIAPSCYGKSTAIQILSKYYEVCNIKIAKPLYDLQEHFYRYIGVSIGDKQDGELLQFFGNKIRKENPIFIPNIFKMELERNSEISIVTNDDCRPPDYSYLKELGFKFIGINGYRRDRTDHVSANSKSNLEWQNNGLQYDYVLDNLGTIDDYETNIIELAKEMGLNEHVKRLTKRKI